MLFLAEGQGSTRIRLKLTESWRKVQGLENSLFPRIQGLVGGIREDSYGEEYKKILDLVEKGLVPPKA